MGGELNSYGALADAPGLGGMEGIELPPALSTVTHLRYLARQRPLHCATRRLSATSSSSLSSRRFFQWLSSGRSCWKISSPVKDSSNRPIANHVRIPPLSS